MAGQALGAANARSVISCSGLRTPSNSAERARAGPPPIIFLCLFKSNSSFKTNSTFLPCSDHYLNFILCFNNNL